MPEYGIEPEQAATDLPEPIAKAPRHLSDGTVALIFVLLTFLALAWIVGVSVAVRDEPEPTPASREASLARQVEALSTRVVELEWRNTATLEALAGFAPVPTSTHEPNWTYTGPYTALNGNAR